MTEVNHTDLHDDYLVVSQSFSKCSDTDQIQVLSHQWRCIRAWKKIRRRLKEDGRFKGKVYYSVCIYFAFFVIGWIKGQFGPSFPDLRLICGVDIEKGSWIVTTFYIGYTFGSILEGFLYSKVNRKLLFCACLSILAAMVAIIPWCFRFEAMVAAHFVQGAMEGVLDPGGNAEILRIWGTKGGRTAILGMNFALSVGSVISPLATGPFLAETRQNQTSTNNATNGSITLSTLFDQSHVVSNLSYPINTSFSYDVSTTWNLIANKSQALNEDESQPVTRLYIAFSITAVLSFLTAISFCIFNIFVPERETKNGTRVSSDISERKLTRPLPKCTKIIALSIIGACLFIFNAIDEAFIAYLSTFCITFFHWTNSSGALVTSLLFICNLSTRLVYLLISKWLNSLVCVGIHSCAMFLSLLGFLFISLYMVETGVWIFVALFGYGKSVLFALLFSWTNEYLTPMTGKISSAFFISAMVGSSLNPLLLGYLMEQVAAIWFGYLFAIEGALLVLLFIVGVIVTKYITRRYGEVYKIKEETEEFSTKL